MGKQRTNSWRVYATPPRGYERFGLDFPTGPFPRTFATLESANFVAAECKRLGGTNIRVEPNSSETSDAY